MNIFAGQKQTPRLGKTFWLPKETSRGEDGLGVWDWLLHIH